MDKASEENLKAFGDLYPGIAEADIAAAYDCFRQYVRLAMELGDACSDDDLTTGIAGGRVSRGQVEPRTSIKTG